MKIESPSFTEEHYDQVIGGYFEAERAELIGRLRRVADKTDELVPSLAGGSATDDPDWNALETLAHMSIAAQFFGWLVHQVATGGEISGNVLDLLNLRDPTMADAIKQPPEVLAAQMRTALERTIGFLEAVSYDDLRRSIPFASRQLSAEDFTRISLTRHLEDHVEQMREALDTH